LFLASLYTPNAVISTLNISSPCSSPIPATWKTLTLQYPTNNSALTSILPRAFLDTVPITV
jgi:hypothetical protein